MDWKWLSASHSTVSLSSICETRKTTTEPHSHGDGYGHLAVAVDDIAKEHAHFEALGLNPKPVKEFKRDGALLAKFFFVDDPDGYKIEVLQKHGRYQ